MVVKGNLAYIAQGEGGLMIIDVSNPNNPQTVSIKSENVRGYSTKIAMKDSVIYMAAGTFGVNVINVSNPEQPVVTASNLAIKPARNLSVYGNYLFTAISEQGVNVSEISYPTQPDIRGGASTNGYAKGVAISEDTAMLMVACGEMGFSVYDISDFQQGFGNYKIIGWTDTPGYAESLSIDCEKDLAYVACGTAGLQIIDYSDTSNIHIAGSFDGNGYAKELVYRDNKVYMTTELNGLQVIDVSNAASPILIAELDTEYAIGIDLDENYIYIADEEEGLIIISMPN